MGCCTSSRSDDSKGLPSSNAAPALAHHEAVAATYTTATNSSQSCTWTKSTEDPQDSLVVIELKEDGCGIITRDIECTKGGEFITTAESTQAIETETADETDGHATATTAETYGEAIDLSQAAAEKKNNGSRKKSATVPKCKTLSNHASIGVGVHNPDSKRRACTMTESMAKKHDHRYWCSDLKG